MYKLFMMYNKTWLPIGDMETEAMGLFVARNLSIGIDPILNCIFRLDVINENTYKVISHFYGVID